MLLVRVILVLVNQAIYLIGSDSYFYSKRFLWSPGIFYTFKQGPEDLFGFYVQPAVKFSDE